jgi:hypothetical protein
VVVGGTAVWFRDRRLWFYGLLLAVCVVCSFDQRSGPWVPARFFAHVPLVDNILPQRFMAVGFLAAAVMVALLIDRARARAPGRLLGLSGALGVGAVALAPLAANLIPDLPFTMEAVVLPRWYTTVAPHLPPGRVLLPYPVAFSGIQVALAWQAVDHFAYSQAGGAGPEGTSIRAGRAAPGFGVMNVLSLGFSLTEPKSTPANLAAVNDALRIWKVNTVVIAPEPLGLPVQQGHDPGYAAAYMTAVLGRLPVIQAGAWVWDDVHAGRRSGAAGGVVSDSVLQGCVRRYETKTPAGVVTASMGVPRCVAGHLEPAPGPRPARGHEPA